MQKYKIAVFFGLFVLIILNSCQENTPNEDMIAFMEEVYLCSGISQHASAIADTNSYANCLKKLQQQNPKMDSAQFRKEWNKIIENGQMEILFDSVIQRLERRK